MKSVAFNAVSNFKQTAYNEGISYLLNDQRQLKGFFFLNDIFQYYILNRFVEDAR